MPAMSEDYPYAGSYKDRHGHTRWRFRRGKKTISLPGQPGEPRFEDAYVAAVEGRHQPKAEIVPHPGAVVPRSLKAAWLKVKKSGKWKRLRGVSKEQQLGVAERFLSSRVDPDQPIVWGDTLVEHLKRRHVKAILDSMADIPHAATMVLRLLRKLTGVALDEEWIDTDPTYRIEHRPEYVGWRAWKETERRAFEKRWPLGTTPRLAYVLTLYTGLRRADIARLRWDEIEGDSISTVQSKTNGALVLPVLPALRQALSLAPRIGKTILVTQYGRPFSIKALGMRMQDWTRAAGLPPGATMHGLRKTLGKLLAEEGATTRQLMSVLGHTDIQHAELYSREAEQKRMAKDGMRAVQKALRARPEPVDDGGDP